MLFHAPFMPVMAYDRCVPMAAMQPPCEGETALPRKTEHGMKDAERFNPVCNCSPGAACIVLEAPSRRASGSCRNARANQQADSCTIFGREFPRELSSHMTWWKRMASVDVDPSLGYTPPRAHKAFHPWDVRARTLIYCEKKDASIPPSLAGAVGVEPGPAVRT